MAHESRPTDHVDQLLRKICKNQSVTQPDPTDFERELWKKILDNQAAQLTAGQWTTP